VDYNAFPSERFTSVQACVFVTFDLMKDINVIRESSTCDPQTGVKNEIQSSTASYSFREQKTYIRHSTQNASRILTGSGFNTFFYHVSYCQ
jgi:hypothetical protein